MCVDPHLNEMKNTISYIKNMSRNIVLNIFVNLFCTEQCIVKVLNKAITIYVAICILLFCKFLEMTINI